MDYVDQLILKERVNSLNKMITYLNSLIDALREKNEALEERVEVQEKLIKKLNDENKQFNKNSNKCKCAKPLISKEVFVEIIEAIQDGYKKRSKFSDALEEVNEGWFVCNLGETWVNALIDLLCIVMGDTKDKYDKHNTTETVIEWWLFEDVEKKLIVKNTNDNTSVEIDLTTPEQLYDYLIKNY